MKTLFRQLRDRDRGTISEMTFRTRRLVCWTILSIMDVANGQNPGTIQDKLRDGDEFSNNLISDLAPLLTLFGEKFAQQFMSFSTSWIDSIIFSMAPLGVITAIVGAIRVGGPSWLRSIIGRARETTASAEVELMSSTSHEVCELWNGDSIVRVMGSPHIQQFIYFQGLMNKNEELEMNNTFTLEEAVEKKYLEKKELLFRTWYRKLPLLKKKPPPENEDSGQARKEAPNISLNLAVRAASWEFYSAAVLGVFVQAAVLIVGAIVTYAPGWKFRKGGLVVSDYSYPLNAIGTLMLVHGMFVMASVVEQSTHEDRWVKTESTKDTKMFIIWLQRGHVINDQEFGSFSLVTNNPLEVIRTSRRLTRKRGEKPHARFSTPLMRFFTVWGTGVSVVGFILQFMGLRGLHWLASTAQLAATILMTTIRAFLRRGISKRPAAYELMKDFELEWLAAALAKNPENFGDKYSKSDSEANKGCIFRVATLCHQNPRTHNHVTQRPALQQKPIQSERVIQRRKALGESSQWAGPASDISIAVTNAIEAVMNALFTSRKEKLEWTLDLRCGIEECGIDDETEKKLPLSVTKKGDRWTADISIIEAILSLWLQSARASESKKKSNQAEKRKEKSSDWLRRKPRNLNMRFLGPDSITLRRDLRWWTPNGAMSLLEVDRSEAVIQHPLNAEPGRYTIDYHRITGFDAPEIPAYVCLEHNTNHSDHKVSSNNETPSCMRPTAVCFSCKAVSLEDLGTTGSPGVGNLKSDSEAQIKPTNEGPQSKLGEKGPVLALMTSTSIEMLFGQHIFGIFMIKVAKELRRVGGDSAGAQASRKIHPSAWYDFRLTNTVISQLSLGILNAGLATSLEEAYICIIPPLSREHKLPVEAAVDLVLHNIDKDERGLNWEKCTYTYLELLKVCKEFSSDRCLFTIKVATAIMAYIERITDAKEILLVEDTSKAKILERLITKLQKRVSEDMSSTITNIGFLLRLLCQKQGISRDKLPEKYLFPGLDLNAKEVQSKYMPEKNLKYIGYTPLHAEISAGNEHWLPKDFKVNIDDQDIIGWSALHYLVCKPRKHYGPDFIKTKTLEIIQQGADPNIRDTAGRTPLHYAALTSSHTSAGAVSLVKLPRVNLDAQARDGRTPLHHAAAVGHLDFLKALLEEKAKIDVPDNNKQTPLHLAVREKNKRAIQLLLENDASTTVSDCRQHTALHLAAISGDKDCLELLFRRSKPNAKDHNGQTALHLATTHRNKDAVQFMLSSKGYEINIEDHEGQTVLHLATKNADVDIVKILLEKGVDPTIHRVDGKTPLHLAVAVAEDQGCEIAKKFLDHEASEKGIEAKDSQGRTPLHIAATTNAGFIDLLFKYDVDGKATDSGGNGVMHFTMMVKNSDNAVKIIDVLLKNKVSMNTSNNNGETPLHIGSKIGNIKTMTRILQEESAKAIINKTDKSGRTPLHIVAEGSNADLANLLIDFGASIGDLMADGQVSSDLEIDHGDTVLHSAVKRRQITLIRPLLLAKADLINQLNNRRRTALHVAANMGNEDMVENLLQYNPLIDLPDSVGNTALHLACGLADGTRVVKLLLEKNTCINCQNTAGQTPLYIASKRNNKDTVKTLVNKGADTCKQTRSKTSSDFKHRTALHVAAKRGFVDIAEILVQGVEPRGETKNPCLDMKDSAGETALHLACSAWREKSRDSALFLIEAGASIKEMNNKGDTALHSAAKSGRHSIVKILLDTNACIDSVTNKNRTALHQAAKRGYMDVVETLLEVASRRNSTFLQEFIRKKDLGGETALHLAFRYLYYGPGIIKLLIEKNLLIDVQNNNGENVLHYAASNDDDEVAELLLTADVINVYSALKQEDQLYQTPLHRAVVFDNTSIIRSMISKIFHDNRNKDHPDTAFHTAILKGNDEVIELLLNNDISLDFQDKHGWTAALCVSESLNKSLYRSIQRLDTKKFSTNLSPSLPKLEFPSAWELKEDHNIKQDRLQVQYISDDESDESGFYSTRLVKANHPLRPVAHIECKTIEHHPERYFEIKILELNQIDFVIGLGLSNGPIKEYEAMPGWRKDTWGYHGDDGKKFVGRGRGYGYGPKYAVGDTVGCGVDLEGTIYFTKNGYYLGDAFADIKGQLFPIVGFSPGGCIEANFGPENFKYNFDKKKEVIHHSTDSSDAEERHSRSSIHSEEVVTSQHSEVSGAEIVSSARQEPEAAEMNETITKAPETGSEVSTTDENVEAIPTTISSPESKHEGRDVIESDQN